MFEISVETNIRQVKKNLTALGKEVDFAASRALNDTAFSVRDAFKAEMQRVFDRPTRLPPCSTRFPPCPGAEWHSDKVIAGTDRADRLDPRA